MNLTPKIQKALNTASLLHQEQKRKADGLPYIVHPVGVAWIVSNYTTDEEVVCAALLHDVLEDVDRARYDYDRLKADFGEKVASIVQDVSEDKDASITKTAAKATWLERKQKYLDHLRTAGDEALLVSAADKIHNLTAMIDAHAVRGEAIWTTFNSPADKKLWFYEEVLKILQSRLTSGIVEELSMILARARKAFSTK